MSSNNTHAADACLGTHGCSQGDVEYDPPWTPGAIALSSTNVDHGTLRYPRTEKSVDAVGKRVEADATASYARDVVLIELGAGMGYVGLAAAELILQRFVQRGDEVMEANKGVAKSAHVVLTDLPDVCVLLKENIALQMEQWEKDAIHGLTFDTTENGRNNGRRGSGGLEDAQGEDNPGDRLSFAGKVTIQVRDLAWGNTDHIRRLSTELCSRYHIDTRSGNENGPQLSILCSDLVGSIVRKTKTSLF